MKDDLLELSATHNCLCYVDDRQHWSNTGTFVLECADNQPIILERAVVVIGYHCVVCYKYVIKMYHGGRRVVMVELVIEIY